MFSFLWYLHHLWTSSNFPSLPHFSYFSSPSHQHRFSFPFPLFTHRPTSKKVSGALIATPSLDGRPSGREILLHFLLLLLPCRLSKSRVYHHLYLVPGRGGPGRCQVWRWPDWWLPFLSFPLLLSSPSFPLSPLFSICQCLFLSCPFVRLSVYFLLLYPSPLLSFLLRFIHISIIFPPTNLISPFFLTTFLSFSSPNVLPPPPLPSAQSPAPTSPPPLPLSPPSSCFS